jgi:protein-S-isoprenylcysteine O-methyltransferase Ste14
LVRVSTICLRCYLSLFILFQEGPSTPQLFAPHSGLPAILPAMFTFWLAGMALGQVVKARRLPQFFGFEEYPKLFIYTGAYAICRHPMYTAWLTAAWGLLISKPYLLTVFYNFLVTCFVVYAALQEERQMIVLFGDKYRAYQKQIPFLLPYGFLKPQIRKEGAAVQKFLKMHLTAIAALRALKMLTTCRGSALFIGVRLARVIRFETASSAV